MTFILFPPTTLRYWPILFTVILILLFIVRQRKRQLAKQAAPTATATTNTNTTSSYGGDSMQNASTMEMGEMKLPTYRESVARPGRAWFGGRERV